MIAEVTWKISMEGDAFWFRSKQQ